MIGQDFLYFIHDDQQRYYYVDDHGVVGFSTAPKPLTFTPDGWQEISIITELNKKYYGFDRSFTIPLNFVEDGGQIIKNLYYKQGIEGKLFLLILEQKIDLDLTAGTYGFYYDYLYRGELALETFNHMGAKVTCSAIEGGLAKLIKANESTMYEIPLDVPEARVVKHDGISQVSAGEWIVSDGLPVDINDHAYNFGSHLIDLNNLHNEVAYIGNIQSVDRTKVNNSNTAIRATGKWFYKADIDATVHVKYRLKLTVSYLPPPDANPAINMQIVVRRINPANNISDFQQVILNRSGSAIFATHDVSGTFDIVVPAGWELYFYAYINPTGATGDAQVRFDYDTSVSTFGVSYLSRYKQTYVKALTLLYVLQQLILKITNGKYTANSLLLQEMQPYLLTCGDSIRSLPGAVIKTSLAQFFNSINAVANIGMGVINDQLVLERKAFWFSPDFFIDLGEVANLKVTPATDFLYNTAKFGYAKAGATGETGLNGRDEFNTTLSFTFPMSRVVKEYTMVSDYSAGIFAIEDIRINLAGKNTTDSSTDNDTFFLKVEDAPGADGTYALDRSLNSTAVGLLDPASAYNIDLSPKRNLIRHGWFLRSFMYGQDMGWIKYQTAEKNSDFGAGGILDRGDVLVGDLEAPRFKPTLLEFETRVPENNQELLNQTPVRGYKGTNLGIPFKGIAMKSGIEPSPNKTQVFQLLASADTDLLPFINIIE